MSEWWRVAYEERVAERSLLHRVLRITLYGSFRPESEKQNLSRFAISLRDRGFHDADIVEGELRPNPWGLNSFDISEFYLRNSDVNFLVFTLLGARLGVTTELDLLLASPGLVTKRDYSVVFEQVQGMERSLGKLQQDKLADLGQIPVVPFGTWEALFDIGSRWAADFAKKLGLILRGRLPP